MVPVVVAFVVGVLGWSLTEYGLHRFAGHGPLRKRKGLWFLKPTALFVLFQEEHLAHHRDPLSFAPTWKKALATVTLVPVIGSLAALVVGAGAGLAFGAGYAATYLAYEVLHRRIHTHPPANAYFAWMRRHHLHHHVRAATNHGVTSPLWDVAFATREVAEPVSLHVNLAPKWLTDESGAVRPEFAGDYRVVGR
ncbi:MAG: sterol desaturase family protein [Myxococcaceae bacterium]|nr:sterol desaturase family protein [Myxococcaceae bacterium]